MENNGDSGNQEFQPDSGQEDLSMKTNGYGTGNEEFQLPLRTDYPFLPDDQSMRNGYSTGNEEFQLPSAPCTMFEYVFPDVAALPGEARHEFSGIIRFDDDFLSDQTESLPGETRQDLDSGVSDQGSIGTASGFRLPPARGNCVLVSPKRSRKKEIDKAYRQRSKETQEKIKEERDDLKFENEELKREIELLKCRIQEKDELMKSSLETIRNDIKENKQQMETLAENLQLKLKIEELEKRVMKAEVGRLEAEKKLLQRELAIANQSSQTQPRETAV